MVRHLLSVVRPTEAIILICGALFHDIGKVKELSAFPENDYTDEGQLLGHIVMGAEMVGEKIRAIDGFPKTLANELRHCILAHHSKLEFGSPKVPALIEALALGYAGDTDAKIQTFNKNAEIAARNVIKSKSTD